MNPVSPIHHHLTRRGLSGDHKAIQRWRLKQSLGRTWLRRPDLLDAVKKDATHWDAEKAGLLAEFMAEYNG